MARGHVQPQKPRTIYRASRNPVAEKSAWRKFGRVESKSLSGGRSVPVCPGAPWQAHDANRDNIESNTSEDK
ncbi:hypothetical protein BB8028_0001g10090 [Beauveria bassiana]|uniref:Uncharacterized protein n=1 Tax=Beauveria bassiana TaxID=176275 RepID=A0A2S7XYF6_BEABA|nr:hypothetical protein BB8028_0001g10090 [Beauveria bassiana]